MSRSGQNDQDVAFAAYCNVVRIADDTAALMASVDAYLQGRLATDTAVPPARSVATNTCPADQPALSRKSRRTARHFSRVHAMTPPSPPNSSPQRKEAYRILVAESAGKSPKLQTVPLVGRAA
jgi:hypothetical protein